MFSTECAHSAISYWFSRLPTIDASHANVGQSGEEGESSGRIRTVSLKWVIRAFVVDPTPRRRFKHCGGRTDGDDDRRVWWCFYYRPLTEEGSFICFIIMFYFLLRAEPTSSLPPYGSWQHLTWWTTLDWIQNSGSSSWRFGGRGGRVWGCLWAMDAGFVKSREV